MSLLDISPVIPVVILEDASRAVPLARALVAGGIDIIELTLRTSSALESIERIAEEVPEITVGAGTVVDPAQAGQAAAKGASFLVSPGATDPLLDAMTETGLPFLAGTATVSEMLALRERGIREAKVFPAQASGGAPFLQAVHSPVPDMRFCPTGGIGPADAADYLALPNVGCVGGSWITPAAVVEVADWGEITRLASEALSVAGTIRA